MTKTCLLTGAAGLLGSFLLHELQEYEIFVLLKEETPAFLNQLPKNCHPICHDLTTPDLQKFLPPKIDSIIHLAQSSHFREFPEKALDIVGVNTISTMQLLDYARKAQARSFIYASSGAVYGTPKGECVESTPVTLQPNQGLYYASKLASELLIDSYSSYLTTVILRFFFIYGPGQRKTMLIPRLTQSVINRRPITLQEPEGIKINPIYVSDATKTVKAALNLEQSTTINVAGPTILSMREIGNTIAKALGKEALFDFAGPKSAVDVIANIDKMHHQLGAPQISFEEGIMQYIKTIQASVA